MAIIRSIEGQEWVMGMQWLTYDEVMSRGNLRAESADLSSPWYALRVNESVFQCGYCPAIDGIARPKKLASLAAMLADVRQQPWLGIFDLGEGLWWYIAIRDHYAVQLGGDVVGTADEIEAAARAHQGFGGWKREEGDFQKLTDLVNEAIAKRTKRTRVHSFAVSRIDPVPVAMTVGAVAVAAAVGLLAYHFHAQRVLEEKRQQFLGAEARKAASERVPDAHAILMHTPAPSQWIQACGNSIKTVGYSQNGWLISETSCSDSMLSVKFERGPGATVADAPIGTISADGNSDVKLIPIAIPAIDGRDNSMDRTSEMRALQAWGQAHGVTVTFGTPAPISTKFKEGWTVPVTIPMPLSPFIPGNGLDELPGLRITSLGPNVQSQQTGTVVGAWTLKGVLYAGQ